jgi:hypothetical protein
LVSHLKAICEGGFPIPGAHVSESRRAYLRAAVGYGPGSDDAPAQTNQLGPLVALARARLPPKISGDGKLRSVGQSH